MPKRHEREKVNVEFRGWGISIPMIIHNSFKRCNNGRWKLKHWVKVRQTMEDVEGHSKEVRVTD